MAKVMSGLIWYSEKEKVCRSSLCALCRWVCRAVSFWLLVGFSVVGWPLNWCVGFRVCHVMVGLPPCVSFNGLLIFLSALWWWVDFLVCPVMVGWSPSVSFDGGWAFPFTCYLVCFSDCNMMLCWPFDGKMVIMCMLRRCTVCTKMKHVHVLLPKFKNLVVGWVILPVLYLFIDLVNSFPQKYNPRRVAEILPPKKIISPHFFVT